MEHIRGVIGALGQAGMTANSAKCEWGTDAVTYLVYEVGLGKIMVPEARIKAIRDYKSPYNKKGYVHFLVPLAITRGLSQTMPGRAGPLYDALRKVATNTLVWDEVMVEHFNT